MAKRLRAVANLVATVLPLFPLPTFKRSKTPSTTHEASWHVWSPVGEGKVRCARCLRLAKAGPDLALMQCPGPPPVLRQLCGSESVHRHSLQAAWTKRSRPLIYCVQCGAFAEERIGPLLVKRCDRAISARKAYQFRRLQSGQHPQHRRRHEKVALASEADLRLIKGAIGWAVESGGGTSSSSYSAGFISTPGMDALRARLQAREAQAAEECR